MSFIEMILQFMEDYELDDFNLFSSLKTKNEKNSFILENYNFRIRIINSINYETLEVEHRFLFEILKIVENDFYGFGYDNSDCFKIDKTYYDFLRKDILDNSGVENDTEDCMAFNIYFKKEKIIDLL